MLRKKILYVFVFCLVTFKLSANTLDQLNANNDHGFWFDQNFSSKVFSNWILKLQTQQRWGADYKQIWYESYEGIFLYDFEIKTSCIKDINAGPGYNLTRQLQRNTLGDYHWVWINRYLLEAHVKIEWKKWKIEQRLRGEYRDYTKSHYKDHGLYRHRLALITPWEWTCIKINPYISNEWFFRENSYHKNNPDGLVGVYYQNRFRVGFNLKPFEKFSASLYWQWRANKQKPGTHPGWFNTYDYGLSLYFNL